MLSAGLPCSPDPRSWSPTSHPPRSPSATNMQKLIKVDICDVDGLQRPPPLPACSLHARRSCPLHAPADSRNSPDPTPCTVHPLHINYTQCTLVSTHCMHQIPQIDLEIKPSRHPTPL
ncbi:hypothetical protein KC19_1G197000 [Ceratodon purpureus]|uniref:Uncharacterized protein n=1 Tax=Ceratodon purpureus TaxID=3225 RepID=A0A8T0J9T9_CERPU|nr:hypothetical protein KC19_1G197000 [Ceratodon purpureus]